MKKKDVWVSVICFWQRILFISCDRVVAFKESLDINCLTLMKASSIFWHLCDHLLHKLNLFTKVFDKKRIKSTWSQNPPVHLPSPPPPPPPPKKKKGEIQTLDLNSVECLSTSLSALPNKVLMHEVI